MRKILYTTMILVVSVSGCDMFQAKSKKQPEVVKPKLKKVDDLNLAKLLLKPNKADIQVSRDPFEPLIKEEPKNTKVMVRKKPRTNEMRQYKFLGVAKVNNEYVAYLKNGAVKGTFRKDDKVKDYTITEIGPNQVTLSNGDQTVTLKRGASK